LKYSTPSHDISVPNQQERKSICLIVTSPLVIKFFLKKHIEQLSKFADVTILVSSIEDNYIILEDLPANIIYIPIARKIKIWMDLKSLYCIIKLLWPSNFDLVMTVAPKSGLLGMISAKFCGIKIRVHYFQGEVWSNRKGLQRFILKSCDKLTASLANNVLAVSPSESKYLFQEKIVLHKPPIVLGNGSICGVDFSQYKLSAKYRTKYRLEFNFLPNQTLCLFVGRLCRDKGVLDLAHAWIQAKRKVPDLQLILVGPDEDKIVPEIDLICRGFEGSLHIYGNIENPFPFYAMSDFLCLPSYREGLGMVILEAAAVGIPAIGSSIYGITDAIENGSTGLLFEPGNVKSLSNCLIRLSKNTDLLSKLGLNARKRVVEKFDQNVVLAEYIHFMKRLLNLNEH
jgi:glycosyltransferase involved in cell wall biosynthesis